MKAVILAAGTGSRLRPLTDNTPKCLLKAGGRTILELTLDNIIANGIHDIVIVTGYLEQQIRSFVLAHYPALKVTYVYNKQYGTTNNIYSLWLVKQELLGEEMLLLDSDIVFDKEIIARILHSGHENCLAVKRHDVRDEEIKVKADRAGKVMEIGKEVDPAHALGESIGIEKFGSLTLDKLFDILDRKISTEGNVGQFYEAAFQELVSHQVPIFVVETGEYRCMEIDTAEDLDAATRMILDQDYPHPK